MRKQQNLVKLQRIAHMFYKIRYLRFIARLIEIFIRIIFSARIPAKIDLPKTTFFAHSALGVVINDNCEIRDNVYIGTHVVIGGNSKSIDVPIIKSNSIIHTGSNILGPITIGEGSVIAPNSVVTNNVAASCLMAGSPAVIKKENIKYEDYSPFRQIEI